MTVNGEQENLEWDADVTRPLPKPLIGRRLVQCVLCVLQVAAAVVAAALVAWDVESILGTCPVLAAIGLLLALVSMRGRSWFVMGFALSAPLVTCLIALLIAPFHWGPGAAQFTCTAVLAVYAAATLAAAPLAWRQIRGAPLRGLAARPPVRFSLKSALVVTTVACVLLGVAELMHWRGDFVLFAGYGLGVLAACAAIAAWFEHRRRTAPAHEAASA